MRHPIRNIDVDAVNARGCNLAHALHVDLAPFGGIRTHPHVLVPGSNPERSAAAENRGLPGDLALQPVGMILGHGVGNLVAMRRDALGARDVDECMIADFVRRFGHIVDRLQLRFGIEEALVPAGDVVVDFDPSTSLSCARCTICCASPPFSP